MELFSIHMLRVTLAKYTPLIDAAFLNMVTASQQDPKCNQYKHRYYPFHILAPLNSWHRKSISFLPQQVLIDLIYFMFHPMHICSGCKGAKRKSGDGYASSHDIDK